MSEVSCVILIQISYMVKVLRIYKWIVKLIMNILNDIKGTF